MNSISFRGSVSVKWFHEVQNVINEEEFQIKKHIECHRKVQN